MSEIDEALGEMRRAIQNPRAPEVFDPAIIAIQAMKDAAQGDPLYSVQDAVDRAKAYRSNMSVDEREQIRTEIKRRLGRVESH